MKCPSCGQEPGWTPTPLGTKDNIRDHGTWYECKKCYHTWDKERTETYPSTVDIVQDWFNYRDTVQRLEKEFQDAIKNTKTTETVK